MAATALTVWNEVLRHVRGRHPDLVRGWFATLSVRLLDRGVLAVGTRNPAQSRYLEAHCRRAFAEAAQAATGRLLTVSFDTEESDEAAGGRPGIIPTNEAPVPDQPSLTFESFVIAPCNRFAHAAAVAVADDPGRFYNPLFIYGPAGSGKTHLLQALCRAVRDLHPNLETYVVSCERLIYDLMESLEQRSPLAFRSRYSKANVLVVDDVQVLAGRERSQEEFFHAFNGLHQSQRQLMLSADCCPAEMAGLNDRLVSRFNSGLVVALDAPGLETRVAILQAQARLRCIDLPLEVARLVAEHGGADLHSLVGALVRIDASSQMESSPVTIDLARRALGSEVDHPQQPHIQYSSSAGLRLHNIASEGQHAVC